MANSNTALWWCRAVVVLWAICSVWSALMRNSASGQAAAGIAFLALIIFTGLHACQTVGWRQAGLFLGTVYLVSFALEAVSIATGFPFGFFTHHTAMGPKPWGVPLVVPLGYAVFGWLAWNQARLIAKACCGQARYMAPVIGAFILAGYDYPYDAIGATVLKIHSYRYPSGLFGVPLSNFLGGC